MKNNDNKVQSKREAKKALTAKILAGALAALMAFSVIAGVLVTLAA